MDDIIILMLILKKLTFAIPFLLSFIIFASQASPFLQNPSNILSLDLGLLNQFIMLVLALLLTGFFFAIFATLASDYRFVIPVSILVPFTALLFVPEITGIILASGSAISFVVVDLFLTKKMSTYITFQASTIVVPAIRQTTTLLILILSLAFYIQAQAEISAHGFKLPSSLVDMSLRFTPTQSLTESAGPQIPQIPADQLAFLEQNPDLLKQYGLNANTLQEIKNQVGTKQTLTTQDLVKPMLESQFQNIIKPYEGYIPAILAVLFFFTLQTFTSLLSLPLSFFTWFLFWILEKLEFTKFETEQREVRKLVV